MRRGYASCVRIASIQKWEALNDNIEMEYTKRIHIKVVHGMEAKLLTHMVRKFNP